MEKRPYSEACERNKEPILRELQKYFKSGDVLEMGHGTGQHALYFSEHLNVTWYPADVAENNWMLNEFKIHHEVERLQPAQSLKVGSPELQQQLNGKTFDGVFTANTLHIMSENLAYQFCREVGDLVSENGTLIIYGPFKFKGEFTSESNDRFDHYLKSQNSSMGIRDFEKLNDLLGIDFEFREKIDMPANNHILVYRKK